jgi:hypothetical protein
MVEELTTAKRSQLSQYWTGGNYELNLSFDSLRDRQWQQLLEALWAHPALNGPLRGRYVPGGPTPDRATPHAPPPTATLTQHGQLAIGNLIVGCDVQATRSLFECVSVLVPLGMFEGITGGPNVREHYPGLQALDAILYDIALRIYDQTPYRIAAIGYERECQLLSELRTNGEMRHAFLVMGNWLAQDETLKLLEPDLTPYPEVRPGLRWQAPLI